MSIADIAMQELSFKRVYQFNPKFIRYSFYKNLTDINYTEKGIKLAELTKLGEDETGIKVRISHPQTGAKVVLDITEGEFGLINIKKAVLSGPAKVNIEDPEGRMEQKEIHDEYYGYSYYVSVKKMLTELFDDSIVLEKI